MSSSEPDCNVKRSPTRDIKLFVPHDYVPVGSKIGYSHNDYQDTYTLLRK